MDSDSSVKWDRKLGTSKQEQRVKTSKKPKLQPGYPAHKGMFGKCKQEVSGLTEAKAAKKEGTKWVS